MNQEKTSKVRELMLEALPQEEGDTDKQLVKGNHNNHNIQVGNHSTVTVGLRQPNNGPELMPCPVCGQLVSWTANACPVCFDDLGWRRKAAHEKKQQVTSLKIVAGFCVAATVYHWSGIVLGPQYASFMATAAVVPVAWWAIRDWIRPS